MSLGWILGTPLTVHGTSFELPFSASDAAFEQLFDRWLYRLSGQFAAILVRPSPRVYVDAYSSLPVLFDRTLELVSSSPFLLTSDGTVPDHPLQPLLDITHTGLWHILGTTPHARAERLLPNHALLLDTWEPRRHWPTAALTPADSESMIVSASDALAATIAAATTVGAPPSISITAGGDTRAMLACARPITNRLRFFTCPFGDVSRRTDVDHGRAGRTTIRPRLPDPRMGRASAARRRPLPLSNRLHDRRAARHARRAVLRPARSLAPRTSAGSEGFSASTRTICA